MQNNTDTISVWRWTQAESRLFSLNVVIQWIQHCLTFSSAGQETESSCCPQHCPVPHRSALVCGFEVFLQRSHRVKSWARISPPLQQKSNSSRRGRGEERKCHWASFLLCDLRVWVRGAAGNTFHQEITAQHHRGKVKGQLLKASFRLCKFSQRKSLQL